MEKSKIPLEDSFKEKKPKKHTKKKQYGVRSLLFLILLCLVVDILISLKHGSPAETAETHQICKEITIIDNYVNETEKNKTDQNGEKKEEEEVPIYLNISYWGA